MGENKPDGIQMGTPTNKRPFTEVSPVSPSVGITLSQLSNMLDDKFQSKLDRIEEKLGRLEKIDNNLTALSIKINHLEQSQAVTTQRQDRCEHDLTKLKEDNSLLRGKVLQLESYGRRDNILFHNVPENKGEDVSKQVLDLINAAGLRLDERSIIRAHRLGQYKPKSTRSIIIKFHHYHDRIAVFKSSQAIREACTFKLAISEDFPREVQETRRILLPIYHAAKRKFKDNKDLPVMLKTDRLLI